ncbi:MAG: hypothetical protein AB7I52_18140 [Rhizobiaceae bacterium]
MVWTAHERRLAQRTIAETVPVSREVLARAFGRSVANMVEEGDSQGWEWAEAADDEALARRIRLIVARMATRLDAVATAAERDGQIEKSEIDAVLAGIRAVEKLEEIMRQIQAANENKNEEDAVDILARINRRIGEIAHEIAGDIVAARARAEEGSSGH